MLTLHTSPLNTLTGLAFGLAFPLAAVTQSGTTIHPWAGQTPAIARQVLASPFQALAGTRDVAEVEIAFDSRGKVSGAEVRHSTGSRRSDAAAVDAAVDLARLHAPADVAGRTLVIRANLDVGAVRRLD